MANRTCSGLTMIQSILRLEFAVFLFGLLAIVVYRLLTGGISTRNLLFHVDPATGVNSFSPEHVQLVFFTLAAAGYYILSVAAMPTGLPDVPQWLLWTQTGSGTVYLGGKSFRLFGS